MASAVTSMISPQSGLISKPQGAAGETSWALPENWRKGLRPPGRNGEVKPEVQGKGSKSDNSGGNGSVFSQPANANSENGRKANGFRAADSGDELDQRILGMEKVVGAAFYRNILREYGRVNQPKLIRDVAIKQKVVEMLESVARGIDRLEAVLKRMDPNTAQAALVKLQAPPLDKIADLKTLQHVVLGLEELAGPNAPENRTLADQLRTSISRRVEPE